MAKNQINIKVVVADDGSIALTEKSLKKLQKTNANLGKGLQETDRFWKGISQQSSNGTKNFGKLAQTIGGSLVPAYATLAANVFALSAAFTFLKSAGDLRLLEEGQIAYASATGIALRSLTHDIVAATGAQVKFAEASQAAAIGTAAGINADQLTRLGVVAKDVSAILGRDVTDSFNRLIRGVTKAEPELLDELGIILRLRDAQEQYKDSLDITNRELTAYERSQAVANFVLGEAETKYGALAEGLDNSVNVYAKLGKAVTDLTDDFKRFLNILEPVIGFLAESPFATLLLATPLLRSALSDITDKVSQYGASLTASISDSNIAVAKNIETLKLQRNAFLEATPTAKIGLARKALKGLSTEIDFTRGNLKKLAMGQQLSTAQLIKLQENAVSGIKGFSKASEQARDQFIGHTDNMIRASNAQNVSTIKSSKLWVRTQLTSFKIVRASAAATALSMKASFISGFTAISSAAATILPLIGVGLLALSLIPEDVKKQIGVALGILDDFSKDLEDRIEKAKARQIEFAKLSASLTSQQGTIAAIKTLGNTIRNIPFEELEANLKSVQSTLTSEEYSVAARKVQELQEQVDSFSKQPLEFRLKGAVEFSKAREELQELKTSLTKLRKDKGVQELVRDLKLLENAAISAGLNGTSSFGRFQAILTSVLSGGTFNTEELAIVVKEIEKLTTAANSAPELLKRTEDAFRDLRESFIVKTDFSDSIRAVKAEMETLEGPLSVLESDSLDLEGSEQFKRFVELETLLVELNRLRDQSLSITLNQAKLDKDKAKSLNTLNNLSAFEAKNIAKSFDIRTEENKITKANVALARINSDISKNQLNSDDKAVQAKIQELQAQRELSRLKKSELELELRINTAKEAGARLKQIGAKEEISLQTQSLILLGNFSTETNRIASIQQAVLANTQQQRNLQIEILRLQLLQANQFDENRARQIELLNLKIGKLSEENILRRESISLQRVLQDEEFKRALKINKIEIETLRRNRFATKSQKERNNLAKDVAMSVQEEESVLQRIAKINEDIAKIKDPSVQSEQLKALRQQLTLENQSLVIQREKTLALQDQQEAITQMAANVRNSLESELTGLFSSLIKNEETSFKDALLNLAKGVLESLADFVSKKLTESLVDLIFKIEPDKSLVMGGEQAKNSIQIGAASIATKAKEAATILSSSVKNLEAKIKVQCCESVRNGDPSGGPSPSDSEDPGILKHTEKLRATDKENRIDLLAKMDTPLVLPPTAIDEKAANKTNKFKDIFNTFTTKLSSIFSKNPLLKGLGDIFSKAFSGFKDIFSKIFSGIGVGGSAASTGASGAAGGAGGGGGFGIWGTIIQGVLSFFAANGGIAQGGFRAFADGGIADRPTLGLVGEGRFNEAIVPMPNGKSIPVEMTKGSGQTNNNSVQVNFDMGSGEKSSTASQEGISEFGGVIVDLIQREIADQTRPGGLLAK